MPLIEIGQVFAAWKASFNYDSGKSVLTDLVLVSPGRPSYAFTFARALPINTALIDTAVSPPRLRRWDDLSGSAVGLMQAFLASLTDVSITVESTFFGLGQIAGSQILAINAALRIDELLRNRPLQDGSIQITSSAAFRVTAFGSTLTLNASARVRISSAVQELLLDVGDLPIALPKINFPDLDWTRLAPTTNFQVNLPAWLRRLNERVTVTATPPVSLAVDGSLNWSTSPATTLNITFGSAGSPQIVIDHFAASGGGAQINVQGNLRPLTPISISAGQVQYGNLRLAWDTITITPTYVISGTTRWSVMVDFPRIALQAVDDPGAVIAIAGAIAVKDGAPAITNLRLIEPYPLSLAEKAADGLADTLADAWRFVVVASSTSKYAPDPGPLLDALARLGGAAARGIGSAFATAASAALTGIAKLAGAILRKIADALAALRASKPTAIPDVAIEVHVDPTTWQLRQIIITPAGRIDDSDSKRIDALGLVATINAGWRPALLFDFGNPAGAYLLAVPGQTSNLKFAMLSTDLWFARGDAIEPVRAADGETGGRPNDPLIGLTINLPGLQNGGIVLAGVSAGEGIFFQKVKGNPLVPITPPQGGTQLKVGIFDKLELTPIQSGDIIFDDVKFNPTVLPFLSKGDSGQGSRGFLDGLKDKIGQVVWIDAQACKPTLKDGTLEISIVASLKAAGVQTSLPLVVAIELKTLAMHVAAGDTLIIKADNRNPIVKDALGLRWVLTPANDTALLKLSFVDGDTRLALADGAALEIDFPDISSDGRGLVFKAKSFVVSRSGLDLRATISSEPVVLNGVGTAFQFTAGELQIVGSRLAAARIAGSGRLPPELVGDAKANVVIALQAGSDGSVEIASAHAELDKSGDPIVCDATRFHFTITKLGFTFVRDGGYHFYFLLTGSAEFRPNLGEYEDGLLQYLKTVRIDLDQAPLAGDMRVLMRHISFQVPISPRKKFPLFNLFEFELRGIGFYPSSEQFDGDPAMSLSGQIRFTDFGDVAQMSIRVHEIQFARPEAGRIMPRVRAEGLIVDIRLSGAGRLSGAWPPSTAKCRS